MNAPTALTLLILERIVRDTKSITEGNTFTILKSIITTRRIIIIKIIIIVGVKRRRSM